MFDGTFLCLVDLKDSCRNFVRCLKPLPYICAESAKISTVSCLILFFHNCENTLNTEEKNKKKKQGRHSDFFYFFLTGILIHVFSEGLMCFPPGAEHRLVSFMFQQDKSGDLSTDLSWVVQINCSSFPLCLEKVSLLLII